MQHNGIEISLPVTIEGSVQFWIDKDDWAAMTPEQRKQRVEEAVTAAYVRCSDDCIRIDGGTTLSAAITAPTRGGVDMTAIEVYDPDSWSLDPVDPDNFWIDDNTGERVNAATGERSPAEARANG